MHTADPSLSRRPPAPAPARRRSARLGAIVAAACALVFGAAIPAHADVWAYVDRAGLVHFADHQVDLRYELFYREQESFDTTLDAPLPPALPAGTPLDPLGDDANFQASPRLIAFFESSPTFKALTPMLREASEKQNVDFELLQALIARESGYDAMAVSPKGAIGLMQIMPDTARRYGVDSDKRVAIEQKLTDPRINIRTGSRYLRDLMNMFPGQIELVLAAYNAGEGAVQKAGNQIPNYKETQAYVKNVLQLYNFLKPPPPPLPAPAATHPLSRARPAIKGGALNRGNLPTRPEVATGG